MWEGGGGGVREYTNAGTLVGRESVREMMT